MHLLNNEPAQAVSNKYQWSLFCVVLLSIHMKPFKKTVCMLSDVDVVAVP